MDTIHYIHNIHYDWGMISDYYLKGGEVFMRQGDLDSACAVYSLMMMLIIHQRVNQHQLTTSNTNETGYTSIKRLKNQFLYGIIGRYREGYTFDTLNAELQQSFKKVATATTYSTIKDREDQISKADLHNTIIDTIDAGYPVEIGFAYEGKRGGHAVVAVGYVPYKNRIQVLCLDPGHDLPATAFWNVIIEIPLDFNHRKKYTDTYFTPDGKHEPVSVEEILIIDEKTHHHE